MPQAQILRSGGRSNAMFAALDFQGVGDRVDLSLKGLDATSVRRTAVGELDSNISNFAAMTA